MASFYRLLLLITIISFFPLTPLLASGKPEKKLNALLSDAPSSPKSLRPKPVVLEKDATKPAPTPTGGSPNAAYNAGVVVTAKEWAKIQKDFVDIATEAMVSHYILELHKVLLTP